MDVTRGSFTQHLPALLKDLSESCCVALDLELSGIATRQPGPSPGGKQTLQARYEEVKDAAETYQILQIGLTFVNEDAGNGAYVLHPYNLHLNPVLDPKLGVERRWSYQSSAVGFLIENGFRMEAPYMEGLPYLSRLEEANAKIRHAEKDSNLMAIADIKVENMDRDTLQFMSDVRVQIDTWVGQSKENKEEYLNIPPPTDAYHPTSINNYQKRLVHQLVRKEYPQLVSIGRPSFIQLIPYDQKREEEIRGERTRLLQDRINKQKGFQWIVEGMVGGDLSRLDPRCFLQIMHSTTAVDGETLLKFSENLQRKLRSIRPALIGHNLFTDLVNFYKCFIGDLPDRVEDFQEAVHELFPLVIDTKYMATHNCSSIKPSSSLPEINESLNHRTTPRFCVDSQHTKYLRDKPLHEAGYDSLLTAQVLIRLSVQLYSEGHYGKRGHECKSSNNNVTRENSWTVAYPHLSNTPPKSTVDDLIVFDEPNCILTTGLQGSGSNRGRVVACKVQSPKKKRPSQGPVNWKEPAELDRIRSIFAHPTKFDLLTDQSDEMVASASSSSNSETSLLDFDDKPIVEEKMDCALFIPRFEDDFWRVYRNKLRVFGTVEEVCDLHQRSSA